MANLFEILIIGLILSADSFSAAIAMGARTHNLRDTFKFSFSSGAAEAMSALFGAIAGAKVIAQFDSIDHWVAFIMLSSVALHMFYEGIVELKKKGHHVEHKNFHSFIKILIVSFATSLDAFAVGVSLGVAGKPLIPFISSIGLWAFFATIIGMGIAKKASSRLGPIFSLLSSIILFSLAVKFLLEGI